MTTRDVRMPEQARVRDLPRSVWTVSLTSFFMDVSSETVVKSLPLFLFSMLGVRTSIIGLLDAADGLLAADGSMP